MKKISEKIALLFCSGETNGVMDTLPESFFAPTHPLKIISLETADFLLM